MPISYYPTSAGDLSRTAVTTSAITLSPSASSTATTAFRTPIDDPGAIGGSGARIFSVKVNVTTRNTNIQLSVELARMDSVGTGLVAVNLGGEQSAGTVGVLTFTGTVDLGAFASGERFRVSLTARNTNTMSAQTVGVTVGNANSEVVAPWSVPGNDFTSAVDDTLSVYDSVSPQILKTDSEADTVALVDTVRTDASKLVAEPLVLADSVAKALSLTITETVSLGDGTALTREVTIRVNDSVAVADNIAASSGFGFSVPISDTLALSDEAGSSVSKKLGDAAVLGDGMAAAASASLADVIALADIISKASSPLILDALVLADSAMPDLSVGGSGLTLIIDDALVLSDATATETARALVTGDTLALADLLSSAAIINLAIDDPLALLDSLGTEAALLLAVGDGLVIADGVGFFAHLATGGVTIDVPQPRIGKATSLGRFRVGNRPHVRVRG